MNKKYMKNTAILFASMTITKIVGAVFKIPLANILGGTGMGYFSTAYGLYSPVFALTAAGIPAVMMRLTAQNIAAGRPENALRTRRTALALFSVLGLAGTLVVALFSAFFAEHIACSPESTPAVIAISPAVMICCIASVLRGYHEGLSDVVPSAAAAVAEAVSRKPPPDLPSATGWCSMQNTGLITGWTFSAYNMRTTPPPTPPRFPMPLPEQSRRSP